jgi:hypothetical protein
MGIQIGDSVLCATLRLTDPPFPKFMPDAAGAATAKRIFSKTEKRFLTVALSTFSRV